MGLALVPRLLIDAELARGELVIACDQPLANQRAYYFIQPEGKDTPPATGAFMNWLLQTAKTTTVPTR